MDTSIATFYSGWADYQRLLAHAIAPLDQRQLDLRAASNLWSVRMIACHIVGARAWWFHDWMDEGGSGLAALSDFDEGEELAARSATEIVTALNTSWSLLDECLHRWSPADLDATFQRPSPNKHGDRPVRDRRFIIWHVAEHDLHHGGEISLTLGMHGVPALDL